MTGACPCLHKPATESFWTNVHTMEFGVGTSHSTSHLHALMLCVWFSSTSPFSSLGCSSSLLSSCLEDLGTLAEYDPFTGYEPNDYHISEATEPYIQESSGENGSLNDLENDDVTIGMALSSPLFTQEREEDASRWRAYHSPDEGLSSSQSSSVGHRTGDPLWNSLTLKFQTSKKFRATAQKVSKSGFFWNDRKSRFSLIIRDW